MRSKPLGVSVICVFNGLKVSRFSCSTHVEQRFQPLPSVSQQFPTGRGGETTVSRVELVCSAGRGRLTRRDLSCDLSFPVAGRVEGRCPKMKHRSCLPSRTSKWPLLFFSHHNGPPHLLRGGSQSHSLHSYWRKARRGRVRISSLQINNKTWRWVLRRRRFCQNFFVGLMNDKQTQECRKHSRQLKKKKYIFIESERLTQRKSVSV